jgi:hypothetical protein
MGPVHHVGLGAAYAFHVTMTFVVLRIRQPDLVGEGLLFSASVIWLGNALIPLLALPVLAGAPGMATALRLALIRCAAVLEWCLGAVR